MKAIWCCILTLNWRSKLCKLLVLMVCALSVVSFNSYAKSQTLPTQDLITQANAVIPVGDPASAIVPSRLRDDCIAAGVSSVNTIQDALKCLNGVAIAPSGLVTIKVMRTPSGNYAPINVDHPNGDRIHIIGDCDGNACVLHFAPNQNAVVVANGHSLGLLDNFVLVGVGNQANGIFAQYSSHIGLGKNIMVQHFASAINATQNSNIDAEYVSTVDNKIGFLAQDSSSIDASYSKAHNQINYAAQTASAVNADNATATHDQSDPDAYNVYAVINGVIRCKDLNFDAGKPYITFGGQIYPKCYSVNRLSHK